MRAAVRTMNVGSMISILDIEYAAQSEPENSPEALPDP
jgi:hypothetical protein